MRDDFALAQINQHLRIHMCQISFGYTVPPKIDYVAPSTRVDVSKGASIKLECRASGKLFESSSFHLVLKKKN